MLVTSIIGHYSNNYFSCIGNHMGLWLLYVMVFRFETYACCLKVHVNFKAYVCKNAYTHSTLTFYPCVHTTQVGTHTRTQTE